MSETNNAPKILIFGGTAEGRAFLSQDIPCIYSAATDYGADLADETPCVEPTATREICRGRLNAQEMQKIIARTDVAGVLDATHPYATEASRNIARACEISQKPLFRIMRDDSSVLTNAAVVRCATCEAAAAYLSERAGNALIATGSKEMRAFTTIPRYQERLHFRVLPTPEAMRLCWDLGVPASRIIAAQGPFSELENRAHLQRARADFLVTKDGGSPGGAAEKFFAAASCGVRILLIERPEELGTYAARGSLAEARAWARHMLHVEPRPEIDAEARGTARFPMFVDLRGKTVLVVGGGNIALRKARTLLRCGARLRVVAPEMRPEWRALCDTGRVQLQERAYTSADMRSADMAIAATNDRILNLQVARDAHGIPVNVADAPEACSFFFPALIEHEGYVAGISSGGRSPAKCRTLADKLRTVWKDWIEDVK